MKKISSINHWGYENTKHMKSSVTKMIFFGRTIYFAIKASNGDYDRVHLLCFHKIFKQIVRDASGGWIL